MNEVIKFWFEELTPADWWKKSDELDQTIKDRFEAIHTQGMKGELSHWRGTAVGRLAEILVLDQFSRNIYRNDARAFASDGMALILAQECVRHGFDKDLAMAKRKFIYMPFMHSESLEVHNEAIELFSVEGMEDNLKFERAHRDIIVRFGRYPHRNEIMGRESTEEEIEFLKGPNSSF